MHILPVTSVPKMRKALTVFQFMSFPARTCKKLSAYRSKIIKEKSRKYRICFSFQRMAVLCRTKIEYYGVHCTVYTQITKTQLPSHTTVPLLTTADANTEPGNDKFGSYSKMTSLAEASTFRKRRRGRGTSMGPIL
jgi:hypothetical protein